MEAFDKVEELLLAEGYSKEEIPAIMVSLVEQGFDPTAVFLGGIANMLDLLPKKKTTPKAQPPKITTTAPTGGPLGTRSVPTMKDLGAAPKPQFGPGSTATGQSFPKPPMVARDAGAFARQRLMAKPPSAATLSRGARLLRGLKGPVAVAAEIGAEMALEPVAKAGGNALTRTILDIMGKGNRARQVAPSLYGKAGPDFTPDIVKGIQQRSKLAQQSAETQAASQPKPQPTGERSAAANAEKQELAKAEAQRRREAAAPKPAPKPPTAQERAYGARSKLTAAQQELNRQYDIDRGLKDGRVTKPNSPALDKYLAKRKK